jgi:ATP-binding cassette subfamily B protein
VFVTFSYYAMATRVMWEFNRIYRSLEGALTDAAQFAELLLDRPAVMDVPSPEAFAPADSSVELRSVGFGYAGGVPLLFDRFSLRIEPGVKLGSSVAPAAARQRSPACCCGSWKRGR